MNLSPLELAAWSTAFGSVGAGVAVLRRRYSRDRTEMHKDRTESQLLEQLMDDAKDVRQAWGERRRDAAAIASLEARNTTLEKDFARLTMEFEAFKRMVFRLHPELRAFLPSTMASLDPLPPIER